MGRRTGGELGHGRVLEGGGGDSEESDSSSSSSSSSSSEDEGGRQGDKRVRTQWDEESVKRARRETEEWCERWAPPETPPRQVAIRRSEPEGGNMPKVRRIESVEIHGEAPRDLCSIEMRVEQAPETER